MAKAHTYKRDHINTDEIIPARYLNTDNTAELAMHCMEDLDTDFVKKCKPGDCIVAGEALLAEVLEIAPDDGLVRDGDADCICTGWRNCCAIPASVICCCAMRWSSCLTYAIFAGLFCGLISTICIISRARSAGAG